MKKILVVVLVLAVISSAIAFLFVGGDAVVTSHPKAEKVSLNLGDMLSEIEGNKNITELNFESEAQMLESMLLSCENDKFSLYYSQDNMTVALKDKQSGKIMLSNPYNAALDSNYSGNVANKLNSQVIVTYLEEEKSLVDMYSSVDCADLGQYTVKIYENGLVFELSIGEEKDDNNVSVVLTEKRYKEIYNAVSEDDQFLLEMYYSFYKKSELKNSNIYDVFPNIKVKENLYYCDFELSERDIKKISAVFETAGYTTDKKNADAKQLNLGKTTESYPNFKFNLNYTLTDEGVKVTIPNDSIRFNKDFPLLKISLLPYFGAEEANSDSNGYLFIPDGTGAVINMNQNEPNRRTIITGKVYGENTSELPKELAVEKTEQYYLPVFGTVRNNGTALFGIITNGDADSQITALLGRPNGNYYTTYPEFIYSDYEKYTRVSVVDNAWSNKEMYLYDKNVITDDFSIEYHFLKDEKANYSSMASVYRKYLFGDAKSSTDKSVINIETLGSILAKETFLGFEYETETVLTSFEKDIEILKYLKKNQATNISMQLKGWQEDGLDAIISNEVRVSSELGGESALNKLIKYCNSEKITLSLYNNISFVLFDEWFDGFENSVDATRTLELQYAKNSKISPDTMLYDEGSYVVKASSYNKYLTELVNSAKEYKLGSLNMGALGYSLNADYTKDNGINRGEALRYVKKSLKNNAKARLFFDGGNAYVLPFAKSVSYVPSGNSGFIGESAAVPFLQMVIGNNAVYNSSPINLKENTRYELLNCVESGTVPTFLVSYDNTSALKGTSHTAYYSVDYKILKEEILETYKYLETLITATNGSAVTEHKVMANGVVMSVYGNGAVVYVNKTQSDYSVDGVTIPAMDYVIKG